MDLTAHRCVWCGDFLAAGDRIACAEHRRRMDAITMPWDTPTPPPADRPGQEAR